MRYLLLPSLGSTAPVQIMQLPLPLFDQQKGDPYLISAELIGGGAHRTWTEAVSIPHPPEMQSCQMFVDEDGWIKQLNFNPSATLYYPHPPGIAGTAVLFNMSHDRKTILDFTFNQVRAIRDMFPSVEGGLLG